MTTQRPSKPISAPRKQAMPAPGRRDDDARPKGTPDSDRHAMETAFHSEEKVPPGHAPPHDGK